LRALPAPSFRVPAANSDANLEPKMGNAEQSNTSIIFGDKYFLKLFRKVEPGLNPDLEVGRFLTQQNFPNTPAVNGSLEYQNQNGEKITIGILTDYLPNSKDAWEFTLETLSRYYERVRTASENTLNPNDSAHIIDLAFREVPEGVVALIGTYMEAARLLGQRSGELHLALAADSDNKDFAPEPFTPFYQRSLYQSLRNMAVQNLDLLRRSLNKIPEPLRPEANRIIGLEPELLRRLRSVADNPIKSLRIRCHGDFHLGQILYTGKDFIAIDFEGEPARPLGERRIKRSPLRDIAGMIRSFDYITYAALFKQVELGTIKEEDVAQYEPWAAFWHRWVSATYFKAYWDVVHQAKLLPESISDLLILLDAHLLEKAAYEIGYEINNRPAWLKIPIRGILQLLEASSPKVSPPKESERV
jgi:maltose alpha-D-glucosyltransferase/alpha-amylase